MASSNKPDAKDLFIYAPIGAAMTVRDMLPSVVQMLSLRGKTKVTQVQNQVNNMFVLARSVGQARVNDAQDEGKKRTEQARAAAESSLKVVTSLGRQAGGNVASAVRTTVAGTSSASTGPRPGVPKMQANVPTSGSASGSASNLAIPDYDTLSATQVAQRLGGLSSEELARVRSYEEQHRCRKTIIGKVDTLLGG